MLAVYSIWKNNTMCQDIAFSDEQVFPPVCGIIMFIVYITS